MAAIKPIITIIIIIISLLFTKTCTTITRVHKK